MAVEVEHVGRSLYLRKFKLYETRSKFYLIGRDKSRTIWRVLKIERDVPSELNISEDPTNYTQSECYDLLRRVHDGNATTGGLKFVTDCYGIVGFVKFLGPYYILLITKRRKIGNLCGHTVYAVSKSNMIPLSSTKLSNNAYSKDENRYKRLLSTVDITKDFFFSYSYHIMCSLQRNICDGERGQIYETTFVWNEYLTRGIRNHLKNTMWTVALVHGFFKQSKLSISGKEFIITLIARRSRHFAGTRYLKRGVNVKGRVANDVETEQIVCENTLEGTPAELSSVVQIRGSIPLFWSQESSWCNIKPDIILHKDQNYESTRRHFDNLVKRYGNPIIILNLVKTKEKKSRESILHEEFVKAIDYINSSLPKESRLKFLHWDLKEYARKKSTNVLPMLAKVAAYALDLTGFFYCEVPPALRLQGSLTWPIPEYPDSHKHSIDGSDKSQIKSSENLSNNDSVGLTKPWMLQKGVLRTNCIDCLDRTNVAQCAYGLTALGKQLHALEFIDNPKFDLDTALADELINLYESMGDTLALQYGGSGAHNKIFCERRGQWKAATQSQDLLRSIQRYYSNAYMDAEKQDAINVFLGHFQPQPGKPALWELDSDQHYNIGRRGHSVDEVSRSFIRRSLSDGNFIHQHSAPISSDGVGKKAPSNLTTAPKENAERFSDSQSETICSSKSDISHIRYMPAASHAHILTSNDFNFYNEVKLDGSNCSNFLDLDWISSCENSCYDENESMPIDSPMSSRNSSVTSIKSSQGTDAVSSSPTLAASTSDNIIFPQSFINWVENGGAFCH